MSSASVARQLYSRRYPTALRVGGIGVRNVSFTSGDSPGNILELTPEARRGLGVTHAPKRGDTNVEIVGALIFNNDLAMTSAGG